MFCCFRKPSPGVLVWAWGSTARLAGPGGSGPHCTIHPGTWASRRAALPQPRSRDRPPGWARGPRSLHVGPRPAPARISILNRRPPAPRPRPAQLPARPGPGVARLRSRRAVQKRPEDASGPCAIDNEAAGFAARRGPCAPRSHLPARPSARLSARPPPRPMAQQPGPRPPHSGRAAHGLAGARGAVPAA